MNSIESLEWRYACKKFDETKTVSEEKLTILKKAFNLTATSFGLQPIKMLVIQDKALQKELLPHSFGQQQVATASHLLILCIHDTFTLEDIDAHFEREMQIRGTEEAVIAPFRTQLKNIYANKSTQEIQESATRQAYIALGNLMTICALEAIDSCPMEGFLGAKYDELLRLKEKNLRSVLLLPIGYRAEDDFMSSLQKVRKPISETVLNLSK